MNPKKPPIALVDLRFVERMAVILARGNRGGGKPFDYRDREFTPEVKIEYFSALLRHVTEAQNTTDAAEAIDALASVAANCQILADAFGLGDPRLVLRGIDYDPDQELAPDYFDEPESVMVPDQNGFYSKRKIAPIKGWISVKSFQVGEDKTIVCTFCGCHCETDDIMYEVKNTEKEVTNACTRCVERFHK